MDLNVWSGIRIALWGLAFAAGMINGTAGICGQSAYEPIHDSESTSPFTWFAVILVIGAVIIVVPIIVILVTAGQARNPFGRAKAWVRPSIRSNFLRFYDPLHFFHLASTVFAVGGLGLCIGGLVGGKECIAGGAISLSAAAGLYLGVMLGQRIWAPRYRER